MSSEQVLARTVALEEMGAYPRVQLQTRRGWLTGALVASLAAALVWGYVATQKTVRLTMDGQAVEWRTHQTAVQGLLQEMGLEIREADIVLPGWEAPLSSEEIVIQQARDVLVAVGGRTITISTHSRLVGEVLQEAGIEIGPRDRISLNGQEVKPEDPLPESEPAAGFPSLAVPQEIHRIEIRRAVPLQVFDGGVPAVLETTAPTVGQALWEARNLIFQGDLVQPGLETPLSAGLRVYIQRAIPLTIWVDGREVLTRTRGKTVQEALEWESISLSGKDYTIPPVDTPIGSALEVQVIRVTEKMVEEEESISYETVWQPDPEMELDQWQVIVAGQPGLLRRLVREVYENSVLKERITEREWVATPPTTQAIAYGTKIVVRELETLEGTIRYWRRIRVLATSYTAATSGKPRNHPQYGITRLGWWATKGVIAVDPRVIRLGTRMYVPGYGLGTAADTGGAILGQRIDLAYDEDNLVLWYKWVDVYLLEPVPPLDQIPWILPDWPRERR